MCSHKSIDARINAGDWIETIPRGAAREIIIRITKATYILVEEFILLCRSNTRYMSNIEE